LNSAFDVAFLPALVVLAALEVFDFDFDFDFEDDFPRDSVARDVDALFATRRRALDRAGFRFTVLPFAWNNFGECGTLSGTRPAQLRGPPQTVTLLHLPKIIHT
jgi:hypothetical protein